jgi:regulator of RNase E activity RraA
VVVDGAVRDAGTLAQWRTSPSSPAGSRRAATGGRGVVINPIVRRRAYRPDLVIGDDDGPVFVPHAAAETR